MLLPSHSRLPDVEPSALRRWPPKPGGPVLPESSWGFVTRLSTSEGLITLQPGVGFPFPALSSLVPAPPTPSSAYPSPCQPKGLAQLSGDLSFQAFLSLCSEYLLTVSPYLLSGQTSPSDISQREGLNSARSLGKTGFTSSHAVHMRDACVCP